MTGNITIYDLKPVRFRTRVDIIQLNISKLFGIGTYIKNHSNYKLRNHIFEVWHISKLMDIKDDSLEGSLPKTILIFALISQQSFWFTVYNNAMANHWWWVLLRVRHQGTMSYGNTLVLLLWISLGTTKINLSVPSAACMRQWIGSALVQIMACHIFGAKHYLNQR